MAGTEGWTRREVADAVGIGVTGLKEWEQAGLCGPGARKAAVFGQTRPNLYGPIDVACARLVAAGRRLGIARQLLAEACGNVASQLPDGPWSGLVLVDAGGMAVTLDDVDLVAGALRSRRDRAAVVLPVAVPALGEPLAP